MWCMANDEKNLWTCGFRLNKNVSFHVTHEKMGWQCFLKIYYFLLFQILHSWGNSIDDEKPRSSNNDGITALLTFESDQSSQELDKKLTQQIMKSLLKLIGGKGIEAIKFGGLYILVQFVDASTYEKLGKQFMSEKTQNVNGFKLVEIQGM